MMSYSWPFVGALFGALLGVGGGIFIVPVMVLMFQLPIKIAVARVVVSIYAFYVDRDYKYVAVTSTVLFIMALTVLLSRFGLRCGYAATGCPFPEPDSICIST